MTALTRDSKATVLARAERDPEFVLALLDELAAVTQENERLRGLLREAKEAIDPCDDHSDWYYTDAQAIDLHQRIDAALGEKP